MGRKRVNRKKKIQEAGVILIAGILVIFGVFLGVKFIPKHQQENISITKPNKNENGTSNNEDKVDIFLPKVTRKVDDIKVSSTFISGGPNTFSVLYIAKVKGITKEI